MEASRHAGPSLTPRRGARAAGQDARARPGRPWRDHELAHEALPRRVRPSNWYLTGFLIPVDAPEEQAADADGDDDFDDVPEAEGPGEESTDDRVAAKKAYFPSSMGLSTLVAETVDVVDGTRLAGAITRSASTFPSRAPRMKPSRSRSPFGSGRHGSTR